MAQERKQSSEVMHEKPFHDVDNQTTMQEVGNKIVVSEKFSFHFGL